MSCTDVHRQSLTTPTLSLTLQRTGAKIVIKECRLLSLSQEIIDRWYGELEIIKRLDHPNIVKALNTPRGLDPMSVGETPSICMEYCDGGDLRQVSQC